MAINFLAKILQKERAQVNVLRPQCHRPECSDTSGTFIGTPALNLKANQGNAPQTIEWMAWKCRRGLTFCSFTGKLLVIAISYHMAFIEERSIKNMFYHFGLFGVSVSIIGFALKFGYFSKLFVWEIYLDHRPIYWQHLVLSQTTCTSRNWCTVVTTLISSLKKHVRKPPVRQFSIKWFCNPSWPGLRKEGTKNAERCVWSDEF